jgi:hypothetical protein
MLYLCDEDVADSQFRTADIPQAIPIDLKIVGHEITPVEVTVRSNRIGLRLGRILRFRHRLSRAVGLGLNQWRRNVPAHEREQPRQERGIQENR